MFYVGAILGIYSYLIFLLGLFGQLTFIPLCMSLLFPVSAAVIIILPKYKKIHSLVKRRDFPFTKFQFLVINLILVQVVINLVGALGPEIGFDALWYHLSIPKIFLDNHSIFFIKGSLFYYSLLPKLTEMLYIVSLMFWDERGAKLIHFSFGLLTLFALYQFSRIFLDKTKSLLALVIFYTNLVVGWESTSAYVDLVRTFYELTSFYFLFSYLENKKKRFLIKSAFLLGFSLCVKLLSLGSLVISLFLLFKGTGKRNIKNILLFLLITLTVPTPWFMFSYINSGNPFYPVFSGYSEYGIGYLSIPQVIRDLLVLFFKSPDPISPLYAAFFSLLFVFLKKFKQNEKKLILYVVLSIIIWCITPRTGESRFFLPYLPALSITILLPLKHIKDKVFLNICIFIIITSVVISIFYRGFATIKYVPFVLGKESKQEFLLRNLNFTYGDFIDENSEIKKMVKGKTVLLFGFHNLYYIDFSFIDSSFVKTGDRFSYVLTQGTSIPSRFESAQMVYSNNKTFVKLYKVGDQTW